MHVDFYSSSWSGFCFVIFVSRGRRGGGGGGATGSRLAGWRVVCRLPEHLNARPIIRKINRIRCFFLSFFSGTAFNLKLSKRPKRAKTNFLFPLSAKVNTK